MGMSVMRNVELANLNNITMGKLDSDETKETSLVLREINVLNVMHLVREAWDLLSQATIVVSCLTEEGFRAATER